MPSAFICVHLRFLLLAIGVTIAAKASAASPYAEIRVVDSETGRGVPLVELESVSGVRFVTDNAGRVAIDEPQWLGHEIYFHIRSHGYEVPKDGFDFRGLRVKPQVGEVAEIRIQRTMPAERLCRLTGEGRYRDSELLGYETPVSGRTNARELVGQDSVQVAQYAGKLYWFWGDTSKVTYPLGLYRTAGATTPLAADLGDITAGIPFNYFVDSKNDFVRAMVPLREREEGVIWIDGLCVVPDKDDRERMVCRYVRRKGLGELFEQGIAVFNDDRNEFESVKQLPLDEKWRHPFGQATIWDDGKQRFVLLCNPAPNIRVPATLEAVLDASKYEAFAPTEDGATWQWQSERPPLHSTREARWNGDRRPKAEPRFLPLSTDGERVVLHTGTVHWNAYRQRWIMIACQIDGKPSHMGEVWYAEAKDPTGPFSKAARIVTHNRMTFYNVIHHPQFDADGGRMIYFEGTYTRDFSGQDEKTPRYEYNQVLYKLDLDHPDLLPARVE